MSDRPQVLRTPDDRFADLPDFPYGALYAEVSVDGLPLRLARVEAGPESGHRVVLQHGEPTWGYLYRKLVPPLADAGLRAVMPDLVGFGRSDKPADRQWFTYDRLIESFDAHIAEMQLDEPFTLVVHDWGGLIGLRWATLHPERLAGLVIMDTGLYVPGRRPPEAWQQFHDFVAAADTLPIGHLINGATSTGIDDAVIAAYEAPFHMPETHAGPLALPLLVPVEDDDPAAAPQWEANQALTSFEVPTLILWGEDDPIIPSKVGQRWAEEIPGCQGFETFPSANHFLQEDVGEQLGQRIAEWIVGSR